MKILPIILFSLLPVFAFAQPILTGISSKWDDSFIEWTVYTDDPEADEDFTGDLEMRWIQQNDFTKWDYDVENERGRIETKRHNDLSEWQIFGNGEIITMRPRWPRDFSEWRITDNSKTIYFKTRYNSGDEWVVGSEDYGYFTVYTEYRRDPRDWIIIDEMHPEVSLPMKMAMVFLAVFNSAPRE